ncbi:metalloregulator ArsR/SmtB family transcription factor [Lapillicoccus sp.]|uniref:ArsR/SmtB family transcription factor n=1 Tax=Lapillicoccus sp. TaxID=1909287 RepID=UPI0025FC022C|nr:metalloregulator ArsR/SmtB family transcription factor [Lapillicoccus sp.]
MHAFDVLGDPVRRRMLELLATTGDLAAGDIAATIHDEFGISHPAVSQHLKVLRDAGFATVTVAGTRRLYAVGAEPWREIDTWLGSYRRFWTGRLDALDSEVARGKRTRPPTPRAPTPRAPTPRAPTPRTPTP